MIQLKMRYRGNERSLTAPDHLWERPERIRKVVVESFIAAPDGGSLDEPYEVVRYDGTGRVEMLDDGTIREAYRSLDGMDRIQLFMEHCEPDFSNAPSLPWRVKHLLNKDA